ncbi:MAG: hypothetical protein ABI675_20055 [Chitinophagaceae bacterium]
MENVYAWDEALKNGCEPREYPYKDAIVGKVTARLDFKIWAKESVAVVCYFTDVESGRKFQMSVFRQKDDSYKLKGCDIDFTECPVEKDYQLTIEKNSKGNPFLKECNLVSEPE